MRLVADHTDRLDRFLARSLPAFSRTRLAKLIGDGGVIVDGRPQKASFLVEIGMAVDLEPPPESAAHDLTPADIPLDVLYEDDDLLIVNKPRGLASHPAASLHEPSLVNALLARGSPLSGHGGDFRPGIVHRLDKETTGLMVVAKNDRAHIALAAQLETKTADRRYVAVAAGKLERDRFTISAPLGRSKSNRLLMSVDPHGKPAVTHVKRLGEVGAGTVVVCRLETGRTHQIRVHLQAVGHPVRGDRLYAPKEYAVGPMQLHAAYLAIQHPVTEAPLAFYAAPDESFLGQSLVSREVLEEF